MPRLSGYHKPEEGAKPGSGIWPHQIKIKESEDLER